MVRTELFFCFFLSLFFVISSIFVNFKGVFHLQKIARNFSGNFHRVKNLFHLTQVRSPPSDCNFYAPKFKNVAVNSLEVVRPFKSCKWNTHFHRKVSNGKTGLPFQKFRLFRKFSSGMNQKCGVLSIMPNRPVRDKWEYQRKMERHFPIKPGQPIGMALATFYSFSEFPN